MIPQKVLDFIRKTVDGSHPLSDGIVEKEENVSSIIESLVSGHTVDGSGVATKRVIKGISNKDAGKDKTVIEFAISDGENSADCVIHNTAAKYLNGGIADKDLASFDAMIRKSVSEGKPLKVEGCYTNFNRKRVFVVETMEWADDGHESQLDAKQVAEFLKICNAEGVTPLDLMLDNDGLWSEIYADEELKKAVLLFCLSPFEKEDMIHFGLITNPLKVRIILWIKSFHHWFVVVWRQRVNYPPSPLFSVLCRRMICLQLNWVCYQKCTMTESYFPNSKRWRKTYSGKCSTSCRTATITCRKAKWT